MGVALKCTRCDTASVSSLFYLGEEAHVCKVCGAPFELANPAHDRRSGLDRRARARDAELDAEWRSGEDRRHAARPAVAA